MTKTLRKRPTQKEVAERAGVSQGVVSQVLNDRQGVIRVNPLTRTRVLQAMHDLGYVPNIAARSLVGGRTHIMGVFTYEPVFPIDTRNFFYPFLEGIEEAAAALNYDLLLHTRSSGTATRRVYQNSSSRLSLADGTLILGELGEASHRQELTRLIGEGHPVVFLGRRELPGLELSWVAADYALATQDAVNEFLAQGHRQLLYLGGTRNQESAADREAGFRRGVLSANQAPRVRRVEVADLTPGFVRQVLAEGFSGLLIENDEIAVRWLQAGIVAGVEAPADYSFAVLGDPITAQPQLRQWTALELPRREMGQEAVRTLNSLLNSGVSETLRLPCRWVAGDSLGPAPTVSGGPA